MSRVRLGAILVGIPLLLRLLCFLELRDNPFHDCLVVDARLNHEQAVAIADGRVDRNEPFWQPPLYPYLMAGLYAVFGPHPDVVRGLQMILGSLSCLLVFALGRQAVGKKGAWIAWGITTANGPLIFFSQELLNVTVAIFFLLLFLWLLIPARAALGWRLFPAGLVLGLAAITVAPLVLLAPVTTGWIAIRARQSLGARLAPAMFFAPALLFALGVLVPVVGVTASNRASSGEAVVISYNGGINFWIGNNPDYDRTVGIRPGRAWKALTAEPMVAGHRGYAERSNYFYKKSLQWIRSDPLAYLRLLTKKVRLFLRGDEILRNQEIYPFRKDSIVLRSLLWIHGLAFPTGILLPVAFAGLITLLRDPKREPGVGFLGLMAGVLAVTVIFFFVTSRYRLPLVPLLALFAAGGVVIWWREWRNGAARRLLVPAGMALALGIIANSALPAMPTRFNSDAYFDLGLHYQERGRSEDARVQYETALGIAPDNLEAANNLAGLHLEAKRWTEARPLLEKVLAAFPTDANAHTNLGYLHYQLGEPYAAGRHYLVASRANPPAPNARRNLEAAEEMASKLESDWMARDPKTFLDGMLESLRRSPDDEFLYRRLLPLLEHQHRDADLRAAVALHSRAQAQ